MFKKRSFVQILRNADRAKEVYQAFLVTDQWLELSLAYLGLKEISYPYEFHTRNRQKIVMNTFHDLVTVWVIFFRGEYPIPQGTRVAIDAGANIGTFSIYASSQNVKKIFALEPFPETFDQLKKNIELNSLEEDVQLKPLALADQTGERFMDLSDGPSQSRGLLTEEDQEGLRVSTSTLADFVDSIGEEEIDLFKIDIEGGEHPVFHSASDETLRRFKHIVMEYHPNASKEALFERIEKAQFRLDHDFKISSASGVASFSRV